MHGDTLVHCQAYTRWIVPRAVQQAVGFIRMCPERLGPPLAYAVITNPETIVSPDSNQPRASEVNEPQRALELELRQIPSRKLRIGDNLVGAVI